MECTDFRSFFKGHRQRDDRRAVQQFDLRQAICREAPQASESRGRGRGALR